MGHHAGPLSVRARSRLLRMLKWTGMLRRTVVLLPVTSARSLSACACCKRIGKGKRSTLLILRSWCTTVLLLRRTVLLLRRAELLWRAVLVLTVDERHAVIATCCERLMKDLLCLLHTLVRTCLDSPCVVHHHICVRR